MDTLNNDRLERFTLLSPKEQKAMVAAGITYSFGPKQSCTLTMPCSGVTVSCTSETGDCKLGDYNSYLGMYMAIICDGTKYSCSDGMGSGTGGSGTGSSGANRNHRFDSLSDDIKLL